MRNSGNSRASLMAAMAIAMMGAGHAVAEPVSLRSNGGNNNRRPIPPRSDTALAREIAEWNQAVEDRKSAKKLAKLQRPGQKN